MASLFNARTAPLAACGLAVVCVLTLVFGLRGVVERGVQRDVSDVARSLGVVLEVMTEGEAAAAVPSRDSGPQLADHLEQALARTSWGNAAQATVALGTTGDERTRVTTVDGTVLVESTVATSAGMLTLQVPYTAVSPPLTRDALLLVAVIAGALTVVVALLARTRRAHAGAPSPPTGQPAVAGPGGLLSRTALVEYVDARISQGHLQHTLLLLGLGELRELESRLTPAGFAALTRAIGDRLTDHPAIPRTVAHTAHDQFAVALGGHDAFAIDRTAGAMLSCLEDPFSVDDLTVMIEGSVGVAYSPDHGDTGADLLRGASTALARAAGEEGPVAVFEPERDAGRPHRLEVLGELRDALRAGELRVHYQPKLDLASGRISGVEALARWEHPRRGLLQPAAFVPAAEGSVVMRALTDEVLRLALADCHAWRRQGRDWTVAVNLSARSLVDPDLPRDIDAMVHAAGLTAEAVELEVTESAVMVDPGRAIDVLRRLRSLGYALTLDDFGTGHSSLAYLQRLPVGCIKIDRAFAGSMGGNRSAATIVRSTIGLARSLDLRTVAEGVEKLDDLRTLRRLGCDGAQGYGLAPPVPAGELAAAAAEAERRAQRARTSRSGVYAGAR